VATRGKRRELAQTAFVPTQLTAADVIAIAHGVGWKDEAVLSRIDAPAIAAACNGARVAHQRRQAAMNPLANLRGLAKEARNSTDRAVTGLGDLVKEVSTWTEVEKTRAEFEQLETFSTEFAARWTQLRPALESLLKNGGQQQPWTPLVRRLTAHLDESLGFEFPATYEAPAVKIITALIATTFPAKDVDDDRTEAISKSINRYRKTRAR